MADGKEDFKVMMARLQKKLEAEKALKASAKASASVVTPPVVTKEVPKDEVPKDEVPTTSATVEVEKVSDVVTEASSPTVAPTTMVSTEVGSTAGVMKEKKTRAKKTVEVVTTESAEVETEVPKCPTTAPSTVPFIIPTPSVGLENVIKGLIADGVRSGIEGITAREVAIKKMVRRTFSKSGTLIKLDGGDVEEMETPIFTGPVSTVSVSAGQTVNLGDYNSAKIDIFLSVPCNLGEEGNAFEYAKNFVMTRMASEVREIKEACSGR